jgi:hypothetical protein
MVAEAPRQSGYIALMAVLVLGTAALGISLALLVTGADSQRSSLISQRYTQAQSLARYCAEEALLQVHDNIAFTTVTAGTTLNVGQGSCTYNVYVQTPTTRTIQSKATVGGVVRKLQALVTVNATTVTTTSWIDEDDTFSTIAMAQTISNTLDPTATSITTTMRGPTTAGNAIIVAVSWDSTSSSTVTCTDNAGNTYANVNVWNDATNTQALAICYATNITAATPTVTATFGATGVTRRIIATEYSGIATASPVDIFGATVGGAGTTTANATTSGAIVPTKNGDLIYGAVMDNAGVATITPGTGFTQRSFTNLKDLAVQDFQQLTAASVASTQTFGTAHRYTAAAVAFKAATN